MAAERSLLVGAGHKSRVRLHLTTFVRYRNSPHNAHAYNAHFIDCTTMRLQYTRITDPRPLPRYASLRSTLSHERTLSRSHKNPCLAIVVCLVVSKSHSSTHGRMPSSRSCRLRSCTFRSIVAMSTPEAVVAVAVVGAPSVTSTGAPDMLVLVLATDALPSSVGPYVDAAAAAAATSSSLTAPLACCCWSEARLRSCNSRE